MSERPLLLAAESLSQAVDAHARACLADATDVVSIIKAGEVLVAAVLEYERRLMDTGWSNPIRHLGRLPAYMSDDMRDAGTGGGALGAVHVGVVANYLVEVDDEELLSNLVEGRGGDRPSSVEDGVRFLFESDSWDVGQYPGGTIRLADVAVDISPRLFGSDGGDVKFSGMKDLQRDVPLIELETSDGRVVDLYNDFWLRSGVIRGDELAFEFVAADPTMTVLVRFIGVRGLHVLQPHDWAEGEAEQIEDLLIRRSGPWPGVVFKAGGLHYEFDCTQLLLAVEGPGDVNAPA